MPRQLVEVTLPVSGHRIFLAQTLKYHEKIQINKPLYTAMEINKELKDFKGKDEKTIEDELLNNTEVKLQINTMIDTLKAKMMIMVKKIVLAEDVEGVGKAGEEIKMSDAFFEDLEDEDGEAIIEAISKVEAAQKKRSTKTTGA